MKYLVLNITFIGTWRVGGVLAVSRAFGDRLLKQYVVADPEIQVCFSYGDMHSWIFFFKYYSIHFNLSLLYRMHDLIYGL